MKNLLLAAVAVGLFSLFSFRTVNDVKVTRNAVNPNLYDVVSTADVFTSSHREFPDKFVATRETWTKTCVIFTAELEASLNEMEEVLEHL